MKYRIIIALALIPQVILVNFLKDNPSLIDKYYVGFFYNSVFNVNTFVFSKINFPIGEILYIIIILLFIYLVYSLLSFKFKDFINLLAFISVIYFCFYSFWGLNYFRTSLSEKFNIESNYEFIELDSTIKKIIIEIEKEIKLIDDENQNINIDKFIKEENSNIKKSIIPEIFLYQRVSGHFIPFTSEAVFIDDIPVVDIPIVIFHEQAHQMGYADEAEASFIAFTKAIKSNYANIRYSGYFNALINLLNDVVKSHPEEINTYTSELDEKVLNDIKYLQNFWSKYSDNIFDKITNFIYDFYLKSNNQKSGILSYNQVSTYIIDFFQRDQLGKIIN
tara:strand:- start:7041 stop:8042 length:1002 start_codon:yes stop_codon:yes gene_type:complete